VIFYYLDASVWIKRYCDEDGTQWVSDFFSSGPAIACSALGLIEVLSTLARKYKANELSKPDFIEKCREVRHDFTLFHRLFFTADLIDSTADLSESLALRGADTVHISSAVYLRNKTSTASVEVVMITTDKELASAAEKVAMEVLMPTNQKRWVSSHER